MAAPFAGLFTGNTQAAPAAPSATPTPNTPFSGLFTAKSAPTAPAVAPISPVAPSLPIAPVTAPSGAPSTSIPASAFNGSLGGGYGASNIPDPASGKPLLTYENQDAKASQLLSDRTAPAFDPTKPQKIDPATLQDPRMKESVSQGIKSAVGGTAYQELDHIMPLELGGSNNKTNLRLEPAENTNQKYGGSNPTNTDALENSIAQAVHNGDISLVDGWKQMAKAKGITLPEQGGPIPNLAQPGIQPNTQPNEQPKPSILDNAASFIRNAFTPATENKVFDALGGNAIIHPIQTLNSIVSNAKQGIDTNLKNLASSAQSVIAPNQSLSQRTASVLNFLTSAASTALLPVSEPFSIASQLPIIKPAADLTGIVFDKAGQVGGFTADKLLSALPISQEAKDNLASSVHNVGTLAGQIVLGGYVYGKVTGAMDAKGEVSPVQEKAIVEDAQNKAQEVNNAPVGAPTKNFGGDITAKTETPTQTPVETPKTDAPASATQRQPAPAAPVEQPAKVESAPVKVSRAQLPVGTGETKTSGLETRMKASLDNLSESDRANISNYKQMNNAEQLKAAADYVAKNPDEALEVLKGNKPAPKGLLMNSIYLALQESGKGDLDLATKLASLHSTRAGQEIQILRNADPFSPDNYIREIQNSKIESLGRERVKTMMDKEVQSNQPRLAKSIGESKAWQKMTLDDFINHITC